MKHRKFAHYFIPHPETHVKARLLSWHFLVIYILLFMLLRVGIDLYGIYQPGVLGINSNISIQEVIERTNQERQKKGLAILKENPALNVAATAKAQNMFDENYWAHFSPSGKDPWGFIKGAGYKFTYAGENLARNFYTSQDVVAAWMNSPTHKENLLNSKYEDIGIAVVEGTLQGQKTTLIVQMFGKAPELAVVSRDINLNGVKLPIKALNINQGVSDSALGAENIIPQTAIDPYMIMRIAGIALISFIALLLLGDWIILKRRGVVRVSSHHLAHLSFLAVAGASLFLTRIGDIL